MTDETVEKSIFAPLPTRESGQRSTNLSSTFLTRFVPAWQRPIGWNTNVWRAWVMNQPVAIICRETLIANLLSLDWKITPRDMSLKDELDGTIRHYTRLLEKGGNNPEMDLDYSTLIEWISADLLDTPFGGVAEVGRKGDAENGRVMWLKPLDAATMYPTLNKYVPTVQYYNGVDAIPFPRHAVARTYMTPRPYMDRQGWGMAAPEKIYFAIEMLSRGDKYYANLLLDIPTAGILDLGDMERSSAEEWVESFKVFMGDTEQAFRVPVLYEHNNPVSYIPFGKVPNDIMFDNITEKYAAIIAAGYGLSLSDIGLNNKGGTLAGDIRSDSRSKGNGKARVKTKLKFFFDQILPDTLQFSFIDYDHELNVSMGRARLASSTAFKTFIEMKAFSPQEVRLQSIADGLWSVTLPDELPPDSEFPEPPVPVGAFGKPVAGGTQKKKVGKLTGTNKVGNPVPPSKGGEGAMTARKSLADDKVLIAVQKMVEAMPQFAQYLSEAGEDNWEVAKMELPYEPEVAEYLNEIGKIVEDENFVQEVFSESLGILDEMKFDNLSNIIYDSMVETLLTRVSNKTEELTEIVDMVELSLLEDYEEPLDIPEPAPVVETLPSIDVSQEKMDESVKAMEDFTWIMGDVKSMVQSALTRNPDVNVTINNPSQPAPVVNQTINTPQQEPPVVIVKAADNPVIEVAAPVINVAAPIVNVAAPSVTIEPPVNNIDMQPAVNNIDVKPADVIIKQNDTAVVEYDAYGRIKKIESV